MMRTRLTFLLLAAAFSIVSAQTGARYLVVTNDTFYNAIQPLAAWKNQKGMMCRVVKGSEINPSGSPSALQIRDYIVNAYNTWDPRPEFVLLVGSGRNLPAFQFLYGSNPVRSWTDNEYANLSGDVRAELSVGRFPCRSARECSVMVAKTLAYERPSLADTLWFRRGTTIARDGCGNLYDDSIYRSDCRFAAAQALAAGYQQIDSLSLLRGDSASDVVNSVTNGTSFVLYRGVATVNWYPPFVVVPAQTDNGVRLPIICSFTCQTLGLSRFESDSLMVMEHWMRGGTPLQFKGGVAAIGNTYSGTEVAYLRSATCRGFFTGVYVESIPQLGPAFLRAKLQAYDEYGDTNDYRGFNLFGDPELGVRTCVPRQLDVTRDSVLLTGSDTLDVVVTCAGAPVRNALVCVRDTEGVYQTGYTDGSGRKAFVLQLQQSGIARFTVTARNALPWTDSIPVRLVDGGVAAITAPAGSVDSGRTVVPKARVVNYGERAETFDIEFRIDDGYVRTITRTVAAGAESTFSFPTWTALSRGSRALKCSTRLNHDANHGNDRATSTAIVAVHDASARSIVSPAGLISPDSVTPRAIVRNFGTAREALTVTFRIDYGVDYGWSVWLPNGLPVGVDTVLEFPAWAGSEGTYAASCSTRLFSDQVPGNNATRVQFEIGVGDVGVTRIITPTGTIDTASLLAPVAEVMNQGEYQTSFKAFFRIYRGREILAYSDSAVVNSLAPGVRSAVVFDAMPKPYAIGPYTSRCSTFFRYDAHHVNDTLSGQFAIIATPVDTGWAGRANLPAGSKSKSVKDGGALAYGREGVGGLGSGFGDDTGYVYAFKGNNRCEFYRYNTITNTWVAKESIPALNRNSKKKGVKKGSSLAVAGNGRVYATKGNGTLDFWEYSPAARTWTQLTDVPAGAKALKEGTGAAAVKVGGKNYIYLLKGSGTSEFYRYDVTAGTWDTSLPLAPGGASGKPYKNGSSIAWDGGDTVFCLKGSYNEFAAYSIAGRAWTTRDPLPFVSPPGNKRTKVKDGSGIASIGSGVLFALKGGNTNELWSYRSADRQWHVAPPMPMGGKRVKAGGGLTASAECCWALRGNNTLEFYRYIPGGSFARMPGRRQGVATMAASPISGYELAAGPNPFADAVTITYGLPVGGDVNLKLYDVSGKLLRTLVSGHQDAGRYSVSLCGPLLSLGIAPGVYLLRLESGVDGSSLSRKLVME